MANVFNPSTERQRQPGSHSEFQDIDDYVGDPDLDKKRMERKEKCKFKKWLLLDASTVIRRRLNAGLAHTACENPSRTTPEDS